MQDQPQERVAPVHTYRRVQTFKMVARVSNDSSERGFIDNDSHAS